MCVGGVNVREMEERRGWRRSQGDDGEEWLRVGSTKTMHEDIQRKPTML